MIIRRGAEHDCGAPLKPTLKTDNIAFAQMVEQAVQLGAVPPAPEAASSKIRRQPAARRARTCIALLWSSLFDTRA